MLRALLDLNIARVRRRIAQGDCPIEPALCVETLEHMVADLADLLPGQHDGAAGEGLAQRQAREVRNPGSGGAVQAGPAGQSYGYAARGHGFAPHTGTSTTPKPSTEQARAEGLSDSDMLQARFNEIMAEIETTGRCVLRRNDLGDLLAAASALAVTPSGADALGDRL